MLVCLSNHDCVCVCAYMYVLCICMHICLCVCVCACISIFACEYTPLCNAVSGGVVSYGMILKKLHHISHELI